MRMRSLFLVLVAVIGTLMTQTTRAAPATMTCVCDYTTLPKRLVVTATCQVPAGARPVVVCSCADAGSSFAVSAPCPDASSSTVALASTEWRAFDAISSVCSMRLGPSTQGRCVGSSCVPNECIRLSTLGMVRTTADAELAKVGGAACRRTWTPAACTHAGPCDCVYSPWQVASACRKRPEDPCACTVRNETRTIVQEARGGGVACNTALLNRTVECTEGCGVCDDPYEVFTWSPWSPCTYDCYYHDEIQGTDVVRVQSTSTRIMMPFPSAAHLADRRTLAARTQTRNCTEKPMCSTEMRACTIAPSFEDSAPRYHIPSPPCGWTAREVEYPVTPKVGYPEDFTAVIEYGCPPARRKKYHQLRPCIYTLDGPWPDPVRCVSLKENNTACTSSATMKRRMPSGIQMNNCAGPQGTTARPEAIVGDMRGTAAFRFPQAFDEGATKFGEQVVVPVSKAEPVPPAWMVVTDGDPDTSTPVREPVVPPLSMSNREWARAFSNVRPLRHDRMDYVLSELAANFEAPAAPVQRGANPLAQSCFVQALSWVAARYATRPLLTRAQANILQGYTSTYNDLHPLGNNWVAYSTVLAADPETGLFTRHEPATLMQVSYKTMGLNGETLHANTDRFDFAGVISTSLGLLYNGTTLAPGGAVYFESGSGFAPDVAVWLELNRTTGWPAGGRPCNLTDPGVHDGCGSHELMCMKDASSQRLWYKCPWSSAWVLNNTTPVTWAGRYEDCTELDAEIACPAGARGGRFERPCEQTILRYNLAGHTYADPPDTRPCRSRPCTGEEQRRVCANAAYTHACQVLCSYDPSTQREVCEVDTNLLSAWRSSVTGVCLLPSARPARYCMRAEAFEAYRLMGRTDRPPLTQVDTRCRVTCDDAALEEGCRIEVRNATSVDGTAWLPLYDEEVLPFAEYRFPAAGTPDGDLARGMTHLEIQTFTRACTPTEQLQMCGGTSHECRTQVQLDSDWTEARRWVLDDRCGFVGRHGGGDVRPCLDREIMDSCARDAMYKWDRRRSRFCYVQFEQNASEPFVYNRTVWAMCSSNRLIFEAHEPIEPTGAVDNDDAYITTPPFVWANHTLGETESTRDCGGGWISDPDRTPCRAKRCRFTHRRGLWGCECNRATCGCPNRRSVRTKTGLGVPCAQRYVRRRVVVEHGALAFGPLDARTHCGPYAESAAITCQGPDDEVDEALTCSLAPDEEDGDVAHACACDPSLGAKVAALGDFPCGGFEAPCTAQEARSCGEAMLWCRRIHNQGPTGSPLRTPGALERTHCECLSYATSGTALAAHPTVINALARAAVNFSDDVVYPTNLTSLRSYTYWNGSSAYPVATVEQFIASPCVFDITEFDSVGLSDECRSAHNLTSRACHRNPNITIFTSAPGVTTFEEEGNTFTRRDPFQRASDNRLVRYPYDYNYTTYVSPPPEAVCGPMEPVRGHLVRAVGVLYDFFPMMEMYRLAPIYLEPLSVPLDPQRVVLFPNSCQCPHPYTIYSFASDGTIRCVPVATPTTRVWVRAYGSDVPEDAQTPDNASYVCTLGGGCAIDPDSVYAPVLV